MGYLSRQILLGSLLNTLSHTYAFTSSVTNITTIMKLTNQITKKNRFYLLFNKVAIVLMKVKSKSEKFFLPSRARELTNP